MFDVGFASKQQCGLDPEETLAVRQRPDREGGEAFRSRLLSKIRQAKEIVEGLRSPNPSVLSKKEAET
jgi:hypothetical protein